MYADGTLIGDSNGVYHTDENGEIRIPGLKPGKSVVVTETRAPDGFILDTQSQTVQIKEGRTVSLTFKNQPKGALIIQKRDSATGQPLPGAEFRVCLLYTSVPSPALHRALQTGCPSRETIAV